MSRGAFDSDVDRFVDACASNDIDAVSQLIERVDINDYSLAWNGFTGLMVAMYRNNVAVVRMLLASESVDMARTTGDGRTALHWGCQKNSVESVRLFLAHPQCTQETVRMEFVERKDAKMVAYLADSEECRDLVMDYLIEAETVNSISFSPPEDSTLSLGQLAEALAGVEREEAELKSKKESLTAMMIERARSQASLVPECPVCILKMAPPLQIFTCSNGHLICSVCKPRIAGNLCVTRCQGSYTGRATAVEQMVRNTLGIM